MKYSVATIVVKVRGLLVMKCSRYDLPHLFATVGERWSCPSDCDYYADANKMTEGKDVYTSCPSLDPLQRYYVLTFDDGPTQYTPNLLANLKQANRTGTMFLIGSAMQAYPGYAQDIMAAGHIVGSHTYSHFNMSKQSNESLYQDMALLDYASTLVLGLRPRFLRPPYGSFTTAISDFYNQTDLHMVAWNLDSFDYEWGSDPAVVRDWIQTWVYQNPGHSHYIYLGHDTSLAAVNVIQQSIGQLESYGFAHTTLDKCIYGTKDRALWTSARSVQPKAVQRLVLPLGNNGNVYASAGAATVKHGDRWVAVVTSVVVAAIMIVFG
ncbi:hypothetical protein BC828DRAFT_372464 [Blastocladiella britannica]|nr:hypothetical protein BC828DRAFT_372464 [Blastocladiella britannica]